MAVERRQRPASCRDRARYAFDRTLARSTGTLLGWLAVCCLAVVVPVSTLLVWTDPQAPRSLSERLVAVWRTSAETLRLGGITGAPLRMLLSVVLGLIALLCVSTLVGVVTTGLGDRLEELRRGRSTVLERGHAVVLGWSDQVFTVVGELVAAQSARSRGVVAVLADRDSTEMAAALHTALGATGGVRIVCRSGSPADPDALALLTPSAADSVLVMPSDDDNADLEVIRVLLALRALLGAQAGPPVVAAVRDERHLTAARLAAGPRGTVLETEATTARLLVQAARNPGLVAALRDLLDLAGAEFHVVDEPEAEGSEFGEIALRYASACPVGLLLPDGRALLTPAARTRCGPGDRLIVVAPDERPERATAPEAHVDAGVMAPADAVPGQPARFLLLGWNSRASLVTDLLSRTVRPGSVLDVVTGPRTAPDASRLVGRPGGGRLTATHRTGELTRPEQAAGLDLFGYDCVIVLGPDAEAVSFGPDDQTLLTLLTLRSCEEEAGRPLPVVAELSDHRSRALAPLGPRSAAVVRAELTALVMARISHAPALASLFEELFASRGGALALRPASRYVLPGREASFATVVAAALGRGECAIGYRAHAPHGTDRPGDVRLAPRKSERRVWSAGDEVLVVAPPDLPVVSPGDERPSSGGRRSLPGMRGEERVGTDDSPASGPPLD
ncbi:CASTOR/POLLUX-related putative ion channel [Streptomyces parvulus]|uniref:CASTOR/POLLUX-related putative ion channel n=1 Tax=Streptomyces parvulus TaxID=146923 RepID=UPI003F4B720B